MCFVWSKNQGLVFLCFVQKKNKSLYIFV
jgi:hypothetical protein